ncbi:hypothetical protein [Glycomyces arizonensis]|uniref:hypothetical protein n=1 Tax=Glycomyces arizonensis TaxID=256035 RepID=UPI00040D3A99|nr:hypothetical protein [Glycomyces arizonensis]
MSRSRYAPHRIRARYLRALAAAPIAVQLTDPIDPARLTVLDAHTIADRTVHFGTMASAPRLWLSFPDHEPALLGYMTGLTVNEPDLWLCEPAHRDWTSQGDNTSRLKEAAGLVWFTCQRTCEG